MDLAKQMGRNAISLALNLALFLIFYQEGYCQKTEELSMEQYEVLESTYRKAKEETFPVFYHTIEYEEWMELLWNEENFSDVGVGFCSFKDPEIKLAFLKLKNRIVELTEKRIYSNKLSKKIIATKRKKGVKIGFLSEAIIIGNYSFIFVRTLDQKSVHVLKKELDGIWDYECGVPLEFKLH